MSIEKIDLVERGLSRLPWMWQDKPVITGLLKSYLESLQEVEDILHQLNEQRSIYTAVGKQLDILGALFSVTRDGRVDDEYRQAILSRIVGSNSSGTAPDIKVLARTITGATDCQIFEHYPASTYTFVNTIADATTQREVDRAHGAGIRTKVCWFDGDDYFVPAWQRTTVEANLVDEDGNIILVDTPVGEFELLVDVDGYVYNIEPELLQVNNGGDTLAVLDLLNQPQDFVLNTIFTFFSSVKNSFTSLRPGAVGYQVVDDRGKFASTYAASTETTQLGYIIDENSNYVVDQESNNLQYIDFT